jgi:hypothetical protein
MTNSQTVPSFWKSYRELPGAFRKTAKRASELWKENPFSPSFHFKYVESKTTSGRLRYIWTKA